MKDSLYANITCIILLILFNLLEFFFPSDITFKTSLYLTIFPIIYFAILSIFKLNKHMKLANIIMYLFLIVITLLNINLSLEILIYYILLIVFLTFKLVLSDQDYDLQTVRKVISTIFVIITIYFAVTRLFLDREFTLSLYLNSLSIYINAIYSFFLLIHLSIPYDEYK